MFPVSGGVHTLFITAYDFSSKRITQVANRSLLSNLKFTPLSPEWWVRLKLCHVSRREWMQPSKVAAHSFQRSCSPKVFDFCITGCAVMSLHFPSCLGNWHDHFDSRFAFIFVLRPMSKKVLDPMVFFCCSPTMGKIKVFFFFFFSSGKWEKSSRCHIATLVSSSQSEVPPQ